MRGRINVYYFTQDLRPILSTEEEILCDPHELAEAMSRGKYAIEDTQKKPQPKNVDRKRDAWRDGPVQRIGNGWSNDGYHWTVAHDGALVFNVDQATRIAIFRDNSLAQTLIGEIG